MDEWIDGWKSSCSLEHLYSFCGLEFIYHLPSHLFSFPEMTMSIFTATPEGPLFYFLSDPAFTP